MTTPGAELEPRPGRTVGRVTAARAGTVLARRRRALWWVVVGTVLLLAAAVVATRWIRSPQDLAAEAAPPLRTVLTADVTQQVVQRSVVTRGTAVASSPVTIPLPSGDDASPVVSAVGAQAGGTVEAGDMLVTLSGRPVVILPGQVPAYRDLAPGDEGDDVAQLQQAFGAIGISTGRDATGVYGPGTQQAVRDLYERIGYQVPATTGLGEPESDEVIAAREAYRQAARAVEDADADLDAARRADPTTPEGADVAGLERARLRAAADHDAAAAALARVRGSNGPVVPRAEVAFVPVLPARVVSVTGPLGATATDPVAVLSAGDLLVTGRLDTGQAGLVRPGMVVTLDQEGTGWTATGHVADVGAPAADETGALRATVTVTPDGPIDPALTGADLRMTIASASSAGEVLAVPVAAVVAAADRSTYVVRVDESGDQTKVVVRVGVSGDGFVEVEPVDGDLAAGDRVATSR